MQPRGVTLNEGPQLQDVRSAAAVACQPALAVGEDCGTPGDQQRDRLNSVGPYFR